MPGVLFEGGTFRAIFSCGVMDALLDEGIVFPYCIGVSAGSADSASYISKQRGRNLRILLKYRNDKRYLSKRNILKEKSMFGMQFVFRDIPNIHDPFDVETFRAYEGQYIIVTTDAQTGETVYFNQDDVDEDFDVIHATCALPLVIPPAVINGREYYDGGLSNPIPIDKMLKDGNEKALIVLTRPKGYLKSCRKSDIVAARMIEKKYPEIAKAICNRYKKYNHSVRLCEKLEAEGRAVLIRPDGPLESLEKNVDTICANWQQGYDKAIKEMERIKALF